MGILTFIILSKNIISFILRRFFITGLTAAERIKEAKSVISLRYSLVKLRTGVFMDFLIRQE